VVSDCTAGGDTCDDGIEWVVAWEGGHPYECIMERALYEERCWV